MIEPSTSPVGARFRRLLGAIAPTTAETNLARQRAERIENRLRQDFDVRRVDVVGSHWKETAVRRHSDLDLFVVLARDEARKWAPDLASSTIVNRVRASVARTYPLCSIRIDRQAVVVRFEQGAHAIDVVPAIFESFSNAARTPVYSIPDGGRGWLRTSPAMQRNYLEDVHARSGRKLKNVVRLLKWWGASRSTTAALSSLYVEHFVAACRIAVDSTYQETLCQVLRAMAQSECGSVDDPLGVSERAFRAARTLDQRSAIVQVAKASSARAERAIDAEMRGRHDTALAAWGLGFNYCF